MKIGDLVKINQEGACALEYQNVGIGIIMKMGLRDVEGEEQLKVLWDKPTWHDPDDGLSVMYPIEMEVINESG